MRCAHDHRFGGGEQCHELGVCLQLVEELGQHTGPGLEGRLVGSNYFPGLDQHRFELDTEVNVRIARGFSVNLELNASRIRDQLSLPRRNASAEEVLLRLRQLRSGFETRLELGLEYRFGSRFAAIVNPRFGQ